MAQVPITVNINGQTFTGTATIPTVMINELNGFIPPWNVNNLIAIWDAATQSTERATVEQFRQYIIDGGGIGAGNPPVLQGNMYEINVTDQNAPGTVVDDPDNPGATKVVRYRVNVPELANQLYTLHRRGPATLKTSEWLNLASGGFDLINESPPADLGETFFAAVYNLGFSGPPVPVPPAPPACVPVAISSAVTLPNGQVGVPYNYTINVTGTAAFDVSNKVKPDGVDITAQGTTVNITGTPTTAGDNQTISFTINNACGSVPVSDTINIAPAAVVQPPAAAPYVITAVVEGQSIFAICENTSGQAVPAPFTASVTVQFGVIHIGGDTPVNDSRTVNLLVGQSQVGVYNSAASTIVSARVSAVTPSTNGTDTYTF